MPLGYAALPQDDSIEGVSRNQLPVRGQLDGDARSFVHDVEQTTFRGGQGAHAGHSVMVTRPTGTADPLQPSRRSDAGILGLGVASGSMEIMSPFVDVLRPGLGKAFPFPVLLDEGLAQGRKDSKDFLFLYLEVFLTDDQGHQVVDIGQVVGDAQVCGNRTIISRRFPYLVSDFVEPGYVCNQGLHLKALLRS